MHYICIKWSSGSWVTTRLCNWVDQSVNMVLLFLLEASVCCTVFLSEITGIVLKNLNSEDNGKYCSVRFQLAVFFVVNPLTVPLSELVLKVRVQNLRDNDFIEIELDRQELTYQDLLRVSCCELGVNPEQVEKIRKLPNTLVRKVRIETRD